MIEDLQRAADSYDPYVDQGDAVPEIDEETGRKKSSNVQSMLAKARDKHADLVKRNTYVETAIANMKMEKARRNRSDFKTVFTENDEMFGSYQPEFYKSDAMRMNNDLHPELRKMMYSTLPEGQDNRFTL